MITRFLEGKKVNFRQLFFMKEEIWESFMNCGEIRMT